MRPSKKIEDWFRYEDDEQRLWAIAYLTKKKALPSLMYLNDGSAKAIEFFQKMEEQEQGKALLKGMRLAWNQHKHKAAKGRKTFSYSLDISTDRKLQKLAGRRSKSATLEALVIRGFDFENNERTHRRTELEKERKQLAKTYEGSLANRDAVLKTIRAKKTAEEALALAEEFRQVIASLLFENCEYRTILHSLAATDTPLNPEQQQQVQNAYSTRLAYYESRLDALRFASVPLTPLRPIEMNETANGHETVTRKDFPQKNKGPIISDQP